jgi:TP901 family phage tail tape measure protein
VADYTLSAKVEADASGFEKAMEGVKESLGGAEKKSSIFSANFAANLASNAVSGAIGLVKSGLSEITDKLKEATSYVLGTGTEFDSTMSKVAAISGATADEVKQLTDKAKEMGAKTKFSASESAEAFTYMAMAGWKTGDMLDGIEGIMNLAAASGEDLATTSDIVTDALTAFGLKAEDSGRFADILAAASSNANTNVSMMGETFKYVAPIAGSLGYSAEDTAEAIGLMANAGIKSSQAGTSLRTIMTSLQGDIELAGDALGEVSIATTDADGNMRDFSDILGDVRGAFSQMTESEKANTAEALVGKNAMSGFLALMNAAPEDIDKLSGAIENSTGTSERMADTMNDNLGGAVTILQSGLEGLALSVYDKFDSPLQSVTETVQGVVDKIKTGFEKEAGTGLSDSVTAACSSISQALEGIDWETFGTVAAQVLQTVVDVIGSMMTAAAEWAANADWQTIGDNITSTIEKIGDFLTKVDWGKTFETITNGIKLVGGAIIAINLISVISHITTIISSIGALMGGAGLAGLAGILTGPVGIAIAGVTAAVVAVIAVVKNWETISGALGKAWETVTGTIKGLWDGLKTGMKDLTDKLTTKAGEIKDKITTAWGDMKTAVSTKAEELKNKATAAWETLKTNVSEKAAAVKEKVGTAWDGMKTSLAEKTEAVKSKVSTAWDGIKSKLATSSEGAGKKVKDAIGGALSYVGTTPGSFGKEAKSIMSNISGAFTAARASLLSTMKDAISGAMSYVTGLGRQAASWGSDIVGGIASGIRGAIGNVIGAVSDVAGTIRSYLHFSEPDIGPLSDFHTYMPDMMQSMTAGIKGGLPRLQGAALDAAGVISSALSIGDITAGSNQARNFQPAYAGNTTNVGGVNMTVYGAQGQSEETLADLVAERLMDRIRRADK